jgi:hypothetical protein
MGRRHLLLARDRSNDVFSPGILDFGATADPSTFSTAIDSRCVLQDWSSKCSTPDARPNDGYDGIWGSDDCGQLLPWR